MRAWLSLIGKCLLLGAVTWYIQPRPFRRLCRVILVRKQVCGVRDGTHGECNLTAGHGGGSVIHTEWRNGKIWAQWRSVLWEDECVCHVPRYCKVHPAAKTGRKYE